MKRISRNVCTIRKICNAEGQAIKQTPNGSDSTDIGPLCIVETNEQVFFEDMSRSPPRSGSWYISQGSAAGPPPMPKSSDRRSPGRDDRNKWGDYYRSRSPPRGSPPRGISPPRAPPTRSYSPRRSRSPPQKMPSPHNDRPQSGRRSPIRAPSPLNYPPLHRPRSPSPRRERPPSPWDFRRRSPPPHGYHPPPPEWRKRERSPPPHWVRRSPPPPHYIPRGRSPPRSWGPPPPEWDRFRGPPPRRQSPPRWGPPPPGSFDRRWEPPRPGPPGPMRRPSPPKQIHNALPAPTQAPPAKLPVPPVAEVQKLDPTNGKGEDAVFNPGEEKEEVIENFDLPPYDPEVALGQKYVIAVSGFFCKICHKFYNSEVSAKITHCKSKNHYEKFSKWLSEKQVASLMKKRQAETSANAGENSKLEDKSLQPPPAKQIKVEVLDKNATNHSSASQNVEPTTSEKDSYDPSQPTLIKEEVTQEEVKEENTEEVNTAVENNVKVETESQENGQACQQSDYNSDSDALITPETKKGSEGFIEATLYNLRKMKVNQLKANLEKRGLKSTGLKTLLLKRLEKVLMEETAAAAETDDQSKEETGIDESMTGVETTGAPEESTEEPASEDSVHVLKLHESDIEVSNCKTKWITEGELTEQLSKLEGVRKINKVEMTKSKVGRKTIVEWTIHLTFDGELPEDGLHFLLTTHQKLPFKALLEEEDESNQSTVI